MPPSSISLSTPSQFLSAGIAAQEKGDLEAAHRHYLEAAKLLLAEAKTTQSPTLRRQRTEYANQILAQANTLADALERRRQQQSVARKQATPPLADSEPTPDWLLAERPTVRLADVAGLDDVKEQIALKLIYPFTHPTEAQRFGVRPGGGLLLYGPPRHGQDLHRACGRRRTGRRLLCRQSLHLDEPVVWQSRTEHRRPLCCGSPSR
jgi:hypothetical protein